MGVREALELLVGEGGRRGAEERDDLLVGVGDGARQRRGGFEFERGDGEEREGSGAPAAREEASTAAAVRESRRGGAPRRDEAWGVLGREEGGKVG